MVLMHTYTSNTVFTLKFNLMFLFFSIKEKSIHHFFNKE